MKIVAVSMARNEADVIEAFVRHHAELVDELVVVDHGSIDGTDELLAELAAEGLPLSLRSEDSAVQRQNHVLTALLREAAENGADWVLPLDADEFVLAPHGDLEAVLAALPREPHVAELRLYVPTDGDPPDERNVLRRIRHRRLAEPHPWLRKVAVPAESALDLRLTLAQGSHGLLEEAIAGYIPAPDAPFALAHFPVRSPAQLARKVLGGWPAHIARPDRQPSEAWHWKRLFAAVVAGQHLAAGGLEELARDYCSKEPGQSFELVLDPVPTSIELRYRAPREPTPLEILAATAEALAAELAEALRRVRADEPVSA